MTHLPAERLLRLASPRRAPPARSPARAAVQVLLRLACAALLGWIGYIHLHLWLEGYRHIPVNGPLFLLDAITAFALAAVLLAHGRGPSPDWPRPGSPPPPWARC